VLAVFALGIRRDWHMLGMVVWIGLVIGLFLVKGTRALVYRVSEARTHTSLPLHSDLFTLAGHRT
jgi:hypothetical protein